MNWGKAAFKSKALQAYRFDKNNNMITVTAGGEMFRHNKNTGLIEKISNIGASDFNDWQPQKEQP